MVRRSPLHCAGMVATQMTQEMGGMEERKIQPTVISWSLASARPIVPSLMAARCHAPSLVAANTLFVAVTLPIPTLTCSQDIAEAAMLAVRCSNSACPQVRPGVVACCRACMSRKT